MTLRDFRNQFTASLSEIYPKTEIDSFFILLAEEYLNFQSVDLVLKSDFYLNETKTSLFKEALSRLEKQEPIQYVLGKTEFYGNVFLVNKHTLIPRSETEELVSWILESAQSDTSILDIGTGTGCIPISLKKELDNAYISAIDVSEKALEIAKINAQQNNTEILFIRQDILKTEVLNNSYDIIVSNPPYVRELEKEMMQKNVLDFEPETALFVEDSNPLVFYKKIAELAINHLNPDGLLFFEINEYLGEETLEVIKEVGFKHVEIKNDIFGKQRMIKASL